MVQQVAQHLRPRRVEGAADDARMVRAGAQHVQPALIKGKAWMTSRTPCVVKPTRGAICPLRSPAALASTIWARRRTKASAERRLSCSTWRSASVSERTYRGLVLLMPSVSLIANELL